MAADTDTVLRLCTYFEIRAILGVRGVEVPNEYLEAGGLDILLHMDLRHWLPQDIEDYVSDAEHTPIDQDSVMLLLALKSYAAYHCAENVVRTHKLRFAKSIGDGNNSMSRITYRDMDDILAHYAKQKADLRNYLLNPDYIPNEAAAIELIALSKRGYDPVTGSDVL